MSTLHNLVSSPTRSSRTTGRSVDWPQRLHRIPYSKRRITSIVHITLTPTVYSTEGYTTRRATRLHARFWFGMSPNTFTIRKSRRTSHEILCPILTSISISDRVSALSVPRHSALTLQLQQPDLSLPHPHWWDSDHASVTRPTWIQHTFCA
jgi:hypothetical protein